MFISIDVETAGLIRKGKVPPLLCVGYARSDKVSGILMPDELDKLKELKDGFKPVFHNASFDVPVLTYYGVDIGDYEDTQLMSYVLNPGGEHSLESWGIVLDNRKHTKPWKGDYPTEFSDQLAVYCKQDAKLTLELFYYLGYKLDADEQALRFYNTVELPYSHIIQEMEATGLYVNSDGLQKLRSELEIEISRITSQLIAACPKVPAEIKEYKRPKTDIEKPPGDWKFLGRTNENTYKYQRIAQFNPNSNQHKAYALKKVDKVKFEVMTPSGQPKVDAATLEDIGTPLALKMVELAKMQKVISSFIEPLSNYQDERGFVHGNFNQTVTLTGRLSSSNPNLQNIPRRGALGSRMRSLFVAPDENTAIVNGDLSNIEARILAWMLDHYAGDSSLAQIFINNEDFHTTNANNWKVERDVAKTLLFAILYGATEFRIAKTLKVTVPEAKLFIRKLQKALPSVFELKELVLECCREQKGVLHSLMGRRLVYPDILSKDKKERSYAERQIFNAFIQGTAGDILKYLTIKAMPWISHFDGKIAAAVHDEILVYVPKDKAAFLVEELNKVFNNNELIAPVPVVAEFRHGESWKEVH
jgi:DNA polymerase-1